MTEDPAEIYADIIHLPHHRSKRRAPMPQADRAAQFSAFAALSGHSQALSETERRVIAHLDDTESIIPDFDVKSPPHENFRLTKEQ